MARKKSRKKTRKGTSRRRRKSTKAQIKLTTFKKRIKRIAKLTKSLAEAV